MIDCPICHVPNDDDARFCAECGQRLQQPTPQPGPPPAVPPGTFTGAFNQISAPAEQLPPSPVHAPSPAPEPSPPVAGSKLHSPLLGATSAPAPGPGPSGPISSNNPELDRLRRMTRDNEPPGGAPTGPPPEPEQGHSQPPRKLRSPLLAQEEFDDDEPASFGGPPGGQGGGQAGSHGSSFPHRQPGQLRSPLLANEDVNDQAPPDKSTGGTSRGGKMRSPLLGGGSGGGEPDYDDYQNNQPAAPRGGNTGGGKKLRSRMLSGGGDDYGGSNFEEEYDEDPYADDDNPNMLRSPLLAAKRRTGSHNQPTPGPLPTVPPAHAGAPASAMQNPSAPHVAPQPAAVQPLAPQGPPQAPPLPQPQPVQAPPAPAPQSQSAGGGWAGPGQPGGPPAPGPRGAADIQQSGPSPNSEPVQSEAPGPQPVAPGRFQGTGTWYSDKTNTASGAADPQSLLGQQPNYGNISSPSPSGGPLWNPADSSLPSQGPSMGEPGSGGPGALSGGPGSSPAGPGLTPGGPSNTPGPSRGGYPEEDYAKLRRPAGEPTPANLGTVPTNTKPSGSVNHPGLENLLPGATNPGSDTARGGGGKGDSSKPIKRTGSRLLSNIADEEDNAAPSPYPDDNRFGGKSNLAPQPSAPSSGGPILLILGGISALCALMKLYVITAYMPTQFWQFPGFVVDQISGLLLLVGLMVFCFMPRR